MFYDLYETCPFSTSTGLALNLYRGNWIASLNCQLLPKVVMTTTARFKKKSVPNITLQRQEAYFLLYFLTSNKDQDSNC